MTPALDLLSATECFSCFVAVYIMQMPAARLFVRMAQGQMKRAWNHRFRGQVFRGKGAQAQAVDSARLATTPYHADGAKVLQLSMNPERVVTVLQIKRRS